MPSTINHNQHYDPNDHRDHPNPAFIHRFHRDRSQIRSPAPSLSTQSSKADLVFLDRDNSLADVRDDINVTLTSSLPSPIERDSTKVTIIGNPPLSDKFHIEHHERIKLATLNAISPTPTPAQSVALDLPSQVLQPARPRFVGAVVRHLSGSVSAKRSRSPTPSRGSAKGRWLKGLLHHGTGTEGRIDDERSSTSPGLARPPRVQSPVITGNGSPPQLGRENLTFHAPRPRHALPDLTRVANASQIASVVSRPPALTASGAPATRPFVLHAPLYTDRDIPLPEPYNTAYPHPITAYASPGVNPETVRQSGYGEVLETMVREDLPAAMGSILYDAGFRTLESSVHLLFTLEEGHENGNGIPESLWSKLEHANSTATRLPIGIGGVSPYARARSDLHSVTTAAVQLPPRFAQLNHMPWQDGMLAISAESDFAGHPTRANLDFDQGLTLTPPPNLNYTPRPSPHVFPIRHTASAGDFTSRNTIGSLAQPDFNSRHRESDGQRFNLTRNKGVSEDKLPKGMPSDLSPFYKTELCAMQENAGQCKYGDRCQYAHSLEDLRLPRHLQGTPRSSLSPPEPRQASCHPQELFDLAQMGAGARQTDEREFAPLPAPIGAERSAPFPLIAPIRHPGSSELGNGGRQGNDMPPFTYGQDAGRSPEGSVSPSTVLRSGQSALSLSLSASSGSRFSVFTNFDDHEDGHNQSRDPPMMSPIEGDISIPQGHQGLAYSYGHGLGLGLNSTAGTANGNGQGHMANSTLVDFSTGKSIWR